MLDSETKRRIDSARDILVGKVPDPKSQVEQITIALVYKFMDDMDKQSIEMGGKASFFKGEFKKYGWSNIFDPRLGGVEMLNLYGEAITRMSQNDNLPELFRNIFKNAFLPYRDPETLKLFLKTINEFSYDHSEKLGDAFEYLLSVLGSQGDAGQFRTPRHIIDFMVQVIGPKKSETVLDPACGTAGFLISAYKYIVESNKSDPKGLKKPLGSLTAQEKQAIYKNFTGYDISPDMVRLSLVNLYLHGFVTPKIHEYDSLTSEDRWNEYADVILANPPFMSPKGGIQPHKRFSVQSNRSEVLFVDYMAEHLTPNGRAAIIVPEGIIFQSAGAYKQLRKYLVENNYLWAVVSLPAGAFNPYSGVKTSILLLDKALAKKTDQILFVKVEADGFDLGAQRRPIERNDLPDALNTLHAWHKAVLDGQPASFSPTIVSALLVSASRLAENSDYNLSADRYRDAVLIRKHSISLVPLKDVAYFQEGPGILSSQYTENGYPMVNVGNVQDGYVDVSKTKFVSNEMANGKWAHFQIQENDILFTTSGTIGRVSKVKKENLPLLLNTSVVRFRTLDTNQLTTDYLYQVLRSEHFVNELLKMKTGSAQFNVGPSHLKQLSVPLPPLETQRQIVDEIAAHQRIIDGARQVVEGWKPNVNIDPDWDIVSLDNVCEIQRGKFSHRPRNEPRFYGGKYPFIQTGDIVRANGGKITYTQTLNDDGLSISKLFQPPLVVITIAANIGDTAVLDFPSCFPDSVVGLTPKSNIDVYFLDLMMRTKKQYLNDIAPQAAQKNINIEILKTVKIPLPPLEVQREIVARIERERSIVEGNRELIRLYEEKVKKVIESVWEG